MVGLVILVVCTVLLCIVGINEHEDGDKGIGIFMWITGLVLFATALCFAKSDFVANKVLKECEANKYQKEYTIRGQDTTYKWVYKQKSE